MSASVNFLAGIRRGPFSNDERQAVADLVDRGLTCGQIAQKLNRHPGSVSGQIALQSLRPPKKRSFCYLRGGVEVRSFSGEEDAFITALRVQNFSISEIAGLCSKRFGHTRRPHTINMRLRQLAAQDEE